MVIPVDCWGFPIDLLGSYSVGTAQTFQDLRDKGKSKEGLRKKLTPEDVNRSHNVGNFNRSIMNLPENSS